MKRQILGEAHLKLLQMYLQAAASRLEGSADPMHFSIALQMVEPVTLPMRLGSVLCGWSVWLTELVD